MKVNSMMKTKFYHFLFVAFLIALSTVAITGCFESNSEEPAPALNPVNNGGGGGTTLGANDTLSVPVDSTGGSVDVLRNDTNGVEITVFDSTSAQGGTVNRDGTTGNFTYIPPTGYTGTDSFTYTVKGGNNNTSKVTVNITVNDNIITSGRDYFNKECGICHKAGSEDQQSSFYATDLAQSSSNFSYDMSQSDQVWNPPLMRYYSNLSQKEVDGLRAYIGSLRNP